MSFTFFVAFTLGTFTNVLISHFVDRRRERRAKAKQPVVRIANGKIRLPPCAVCGYDQHTASVGAFVRLVEGVNASEWPCFVCGASMRAAHLSSDVAAEMRFRLAKNEAYKAAAGEAPDA